MNQDCSTCKYEHCDVDAEPCARCGWHKDLWQPKDTAPEKKTGGMSFSDFRFFVSNFGDALIRTYKPIHIIHNPPATICFFSDGKKIISKCHDEPFDEEHGVAMCIAKKLYGSRTAFLKACRAKRIV